MTKILQKDAVLKRIHENGFASNIWAIRNNILRLSAIVLKLKYDGFRICGVFGKYLSLNGKPLPKRYWNNYYYTFEKNSKFNNKTGLWNSLADTDSLI